MSSNADASVAAMVDALSSYYSDKYCAVAASVLFIYDTWVTLDREVAYFWTAKPTGASLLFFANKWISMAVNVMLLTAEAASFPANKIVRYGSMTTGICSCSAFEVAVFAVGLLQFVPWAVFSALRAYVLAQSKLLGLLILALSLAPVGANLVQYGYHLSGENFPIFGCLETTTATVALQLKFGSPHPLFLSVCTHVTQEVVTIISRVALIVADVLLIYITWAKLSCQDASRNIRQFGKRLSLSDILFRNGTIYFVVLFILNTLHLGLLVAASVGIGHGEADSSTVTLFTTVLTAVAASIGSLTAILVSHFLLELQEADRTVIRLGRDDPLYLASNPYDNTPSFISSLGGFINVDYPVAPSDGDAVEPHVASRSNAVEEGEAQAIQAAAPSSSA